MNKIIYSLFAFLANSRGSKDGTSTTYQEEEISSLKAELNEIYHSDQTYRRLFTIKLFKTFSQSLFQINCL